ncbi:MAG TPA: 50S ribosomal protein L24 [bacterium]|nr:50S ribosomal protein L24 [bacterium]
MIKTKIKKNDTVVSIKGRDRGKSGRVIRVDHKSGKILVEGINMHKKASRPNRNNPQGGIIHMEKPMPLANVMLYCGKCKKPTKASMRSLAESKKERFCKTCGETM